MGPVDTIGGRVDRWYTVGMAIETQELDRLAGGRPSPVPPFCLGCGYDLTGAVSAQCPECGRVFVAKEWWQNVAEIQGRAHQMKEINEWVSHGLKLAVASLVVSLIPLLIGPSCMAHVLEILAVLGGIPAVLLGLGAFRAKRLPAWARARMALSPDYTRAVGAVLLGGAAVALATLGLW